METRALHLNPESRVLTIRSPTGMGQELKLKRLLPHPGTEATIWSLGGSRYLIRLQGQVGQDDQYAVVDGVRGYQVPAPQGTILQQHPRDKTAFLTWQDRFTHGGRGDWDYALVRIERLGPIGPDARWQFGGSKLIQDERQGATFGPDGPEILIGRGLVPDKVVYLRGQPYQITHEQDGEEATIRTDPTGRQRIVGGVLTQVSASGGLAGEEMVYRSFSGREWPIPDLEHVDLIDDEPSQLAWDRVVGAGLAAALPAALARYVLRVALPETI